MNGKKKRWTEFKNLYLNETKIIKKIKWTERINTEQRVKNKFDKKFFWMRIITLIAAVEN